MVFVLHRRHLIRLPHHTFRHISRHFSHPTFHRSSRHISRHISRHFSRRSSPHISRHISHQVSLLLAQVVLRQDLVTLMMGVRGQATVFAHSPLMVAYQQDAQDVTVLQCTEVARVQVAHNDLNLILG